MFSKKFLLIQSVFLAIACVLCLMYVSSSFKKIPVIAQVQDFQLIDSQNQSFGLKDLKGKIWVADFFFTTCSNICPMMSAHMKRLSESFKSYPDVRLVSVSVNPENDTPETLQNYAKKFKADSSRWIFLTGTRQDITKLVVESFKLGDIKEPVFHSSYFSLVDQQGQIRGYYDSSDPNSMDLIIKDLKILRFPLHATLNAALNGLAGVLLFLGFLSIKQGKKEQHSRFMVAAFASSAAFLCSYLYYHATTHVITRYLGHGIMKVVYFFILGTHTILAVLIVPFILLAFRHALKGRFEKHVAITRWLYPAWMYVSVTGVVVYLMLYVFPAH